MNSRSSFALTFLVSSALFATALAANPPANICIELTNWINETQAKAQTQPPAQEGGGTAVEQARPGGGQTPGGQDPAQKTSGMSGQVTQSGPGAAGPQGDAQESAKTAAANPKPDARQNAQAAKPAAPAPAAEPKAPPPNPQAIEKARQSAGANDLDGCSSAVRDMRLAGVALPGPLLALAALKPELRRLAPQGPAPGVPPIPLSGVAPDEASPASPPQPPDQRR